MKSYQPTPKEVVYLLHFSRPYKQARHYLGWTNHYGRRMRQHREGNGASLTRAAVADGIQLIVARRWWGYDRHDEKHLRQMKCNPKLCPLCNPTAHHRTVGRHKDITF